MSENQKNIVKKKPAKLPKNIIRRDGSTSPFDLNRIAIAVGKALKATKEADEKESRYVAYAVAKELQERVKEDKNYVPHVEEIQDIVENELIMMNYSKTAKAYILYRQARAEKRKQSGVAVSAEVRKVVNESKKYFRNALSEFVFYSSYSRWIPEKGRREAWVETVDRYMDFMREKLGKKLVPAEYAEVRKYILGMKALGSMRLLWAAGHAAHASNICAYNCSFVAPTSWKDLGEIMYVLMCGTGIGFSVERQNAELFPIIKRQTGKKLLTHLVGDSREGWAEALVLGLETWSSGAEIDFDYSKVRPQGARLKTMGGRASGPDPLRALFDFARSKMVLRQGRHLTTLDLHDIICKIGEVVVAGGVRRSALISLSELDDSDMRGAKSGQFYFTHPERAMANNSTVYNEKPTTEQFLEEWISLMKSGSGERGIFNRGSLQKQLPERRWKTFVKDAENCGINPCGEIVLKSKQFCNLSEVVARMEDTEKTLLDKVRVAAILGTYQATLTDFPYISKEWKKNCEEEALLGVSITGQWDCPAVRNPKTLEKLKKMAVETNKKYAKRFGINQSTCVTCVKPSGNGSQLFDSASGCHPRHAKCYIRRVRIEGHNPIFMMLKDLGVPYSPEVGQSAATAKTFVLEFPIKTTKGAVVKKDLNAIDQLEYWKMLKNHYTEHNPSVTILVGNDEWLKVGSWVYENWDIVGGLSFLPKDENIYQLAPYEEITEEKCDELIKNFPKIDFSKLVTYEYEDETKGSKELACVAGLCEIEHIPEEGKK